MFGKGKAVYQFQHYDIKNRLLLGDESYTIVLNSKAEAGKIPKELKALFSYINEGKVNPGRDDFIDEVHQKVLELNGDEKLMGVMTLEMDRRMREDWAEERGRRRQGLDLGRQEGLDLGICAFISGSRKEKYFGRRNQKKTDRLVQLDRIRSQGIYSEVYRIKNIYCLYLMKNNI